MHFDNKNDHDGNVFWKLPLWRAIPGSRDCVLHTDENMEVFLLRARGEDDIDTIINFVSESFVTISGNIQASSAHSTIKMKKKKKKSYLSKNFNQIAMVGNNFFANLPTL